MMHDFLRTQIVNKGCVQLDVLRLDRVTKEMILTKELFHNSLLQNLPSNISLCIFNICRFQKLKKIMAVWYQKMLIMCGGFLNISKSRHWSYTKIAFYSGLYTVKAQKWILNKMQNQKTPLVWWYHRTACFKRDLGFFISYTKTACTTLSKFIIALIKSLKTEVWFPH